MLELPTTRHTKQVNTYFSQRFHYELFEEIFEEFATQTIRFTPIKLSDN